MTVPSGVCVVIVSYVIKSRTNIIWIYMSEVTYYHRTCQTHCQSTGHTCWWRPLPWLSSSDPPCADPPHTGPLIIMMIMIIIMRNDNEGYYRAPGQAPAAGRPPPPWPAWGPARPAWPPGTRCSIRIWRAADIKSYQKWWPHLHQEAKCSQLLLTTL